MSPPNLRALAPKNCRKASNLSSENPKFLGSSGRLKGEANRRRPCSKDPILGGGHSSKGLQRNGKSCRLRWINYLRPGLKHDMFSREEETVMNLHAALGNKWSQIVMHIPGRTDNEVKNYWNSYLKKRKEDRVFVQQVMKQALQPEDVTTGVIRRGNGERMSFACKEI